MPRLTRALLALGVVATVALGGCGDDGDKKEETAGPTTSAEPELSSYESVTDIEAALNDAGLECTLEYEGLKDERSEVSICNIDGRRATLNIFTDEEFVAEFLDESPEADRVAVGLNWTVDTATPETATQVAEALGGVVPAAERVRD